MPTVAELSRFARQPEVKNFELAKEWLLDGASTRH
jgi:hypothetical protein